MNVPAGRECACVAMQTVHATEAMTFEQQRKAYGRVVTWLDPIAWARCPVCYGTGRDRRP